MKGKIKLLLVLICLSIIRHPEIYAQNKFLGIPVTEHFEPRDYEAFPTCLDITQDSRNLIYVATPQGLVIYDGNEWDQLYAMVDGKGMVLTAVCADPSGRIYIGSQEKDIGYYFPGANGQYKYHSLNYLLTDQRPDPFNTITNIFPYRRGYVFTSESNLYFYQDDRITDLAVKAPNGYNTYLSNGNLYVNITGQGLAVLNGRNWELLSGATVFANEQVSTLIHLSNNVLLVCTKDNGIYQLENTEVVPFALNLFDDFSKFKIYSATKLSDGLIAIGTQLNGLYILNKQGELIYHFRKGIGLTNDSSIEEIFEDSFGNIWLARENGITKIEWNSPISIINNDLGLPGSGTKVYASKDLIYFGTYNGLSYAVNKLPIETISKVENVEGFVYDIQKMNGGLLVCTQFGAYQFIDNELQKIPIEGNWFSFKQTRNPDIIIGGHENGIYRLERIHGIWTVSNKYDYNLRTQYFEFDDQDRLWSISSTGVYSLTFSDDYKKITSKILYDSTKGLPPTKYKYVYKVGNELIYSTNVGIYTYDTTTDEFTLSPIWNTRFAQNILDIYNLKVDPLENIYYADTQQPGRLKKNKWNEYTNEYSLFNNIRYHLQRGMTIISILDENNVLFAIPEGFVHFNNQFRQNTSNQANLLIRSVKLTLSDSILFGGNFVADNKVVHEQPPDQIPSLPYTDNSLTFKYSSVEYNKNYVLYRYKLEGLNANWSKWTANTKKEYTSLYEGNYTFKVQTKDSNNHITSETTYQFEIQPPWYRTYLAYSGYLIGILGFTSFTFLSYRRKKKKEIGDLHKEKLQVEIQHKKSQLAARTMHLIDKSELISSIKKHVRDILKDDGNTNVFRQLRKIIREIDRNNHSDDNWSEFEIYFDDVHEDFLKRIRHDFPAITAREIRLCSYLRMNLSTKEISDLLKISVRGVEVARYRLRKKLKIANEENLVDYMMNY